MPRAGWRCPRMRDVRVTQSYVPATVFASSAAPRVVGTRDAVLDSRRPCCTRTVHGREKRTSEVSAVIIPERRRGWLMLVLLSAVLAVLCPMLLAVTGFPLFIWLTAIAVLALVGTAIGAIAHPP